MLYANNKRLSFRQQCFRYENTQNQSGRSERSDAARQQPSMGTQAPGLAVLFKLVALGGQWLPYQEMAKQMYLSQFETHAAMQRLVACRLARTDEDGSVRPIMQVLHPFVFYGAAYVYPAVRTEITIGFATAYGAAPMKEHVLYADEFPPVWPHAEGTVRGLGLLPLYANAPLAAREDSTLAQMMTLFDALRIGQAREREKAGELLALRLR